MCILGGFITAPRSCIIWVSLQGEWGYYRLTGWSNKALGQCPTRLPDGEGIVFHWAMCVQVLDGRSRDWLLQLIPPVPGPRPQDLLPGGLSSAINIIILCPFVYGDTNLQFVSC